MHIAEVDAYFVSPADARKLSNFPQSSLNFGLLRQLALKYIENGNFSESPQQKLQSLLDFRIKTNGGLRKCNRVLHAKRPHHTMHAFVGNSFAHQGVQNGHVTDVDVHHIDAEFFQSTHGKRHNLGISLNAAGAEEFDARNHRFSACQRMHRTRVQTAARIAQAAHALAAQNMRVNARALRRHVGADADRAARTRIHELERAVVQIAAAAGQKRIYVLHHRRLNQFKAVYLKKVEAFASHRLEYASFARQNIREMLRNKPTDHMF